MREKGNSKERRKVIKKFQFVGKSLVASESGDSPLWVYINPDSEEKNSLMTNCNIANCNIDDHTLSSALDPDEASRVEFGKDSLFLIWKRPLQYSGEDNFSFNVASVGVFLIKERLVLVLTEDISLIDTGAIRVPPLDSLPDVLLTFLYNTVQHYLVHLKIIKSIARELEQRISTSMENRHLIQMFNLSESLVYYLNAINGNNVVLNRLRSYAEKMNFGPQTIDLLDDLIIENNQCFQQAEIYSRVIAGLMDARGTLVNNNMGVLLKNLTIINVIFLPLNLIAGIGGMSEFSMMTQGIDWRISYFLFFVALVLIGCFTAFMLRTTGLMGDLTKKNKKKLKKGQAMETSPGK